MIQIIDFTNCKLSSRNLQYGGRAGKKRGIVYNNEFWFLKFPKNTMGMKNVGTLAFVASPVSEFIGSNIYKILGYNSHKTLLGICFDGKQNKIVCACKDFIIDDTNELLIPYTAIRNDTNSWVMEYSNNNIDSSCNINDISFQLKHNSVLSTIKDAEEKFLTNIIIDVLINNNDRNEDNWGVIKNKKENSYTLAPVYDCGNCFYGKTSEERIENILNDDSKLYSSALNGTTAYEDDEGKKVTAVNILEYVKNTKEEIINKTYENVVQHLDEIEKFINSIPNSYEDIEIISDIRKEYYIKTLKIRLEYIYDKYIK